MLAANVCWVFVTIFVLLGVIFQPFGSPQQWCWTSVITMVISIVMWFIAGHSRGE